MELKLNISKRNISTSEETVTEEVVLNYGHIFRGKDGKDGINGINGRDGRDGQDGIDGQDGKNGNTPLLKIVSDYWYASYDNGVSWNKLSKATGENGKDGNRRRYSRNRLQECPYKGYQ